jgi:hypothetical protein
MIIYKEKNVCIIYLLVLFGENKIVIDVANKKMVRERTVSYNTFKFVDGIANKI